MKSIPVIAALIGCFSGVAMSQNIEVVTEEWPPFITNENPISGIVTEKVKEILEQTNLDYTLRIYPWARSFHKAKNEPNVLIYSIYRTDEREPHFHWFCPIYHSTPIHAYKLASNNHPIDSLEDLRKVRIGIMRGDNSHRYFVNQGFKEGKELDISSDEATNIKKLLFGRVDVVIQSNESIHYRLSQFNAPDVEVVKGFAIHKKDQTEHCMALNKDSDPNIVQQLQNSFDAWQESQAK